MSVSESVVCPNCSEKVPTDYVICPYCGYSLVETLREKIRTKIGFKSAIGRIYRLIRDPIKSTKVVTKDIGINSDLKGPSLVVFLFILGFTMKASVLLTKVSGFRTPLISLGGSITSIILGLAYIIVYQVGYYMSVFLIIPSVMALVLWLFGIIFWRFLALLFHGICKALAGTGRRIETASIVGYSIIPLFISQVLEAIILFFVAPVDPTIVNNRFTDPFLGTFRLLELVVLPFMVWSAYILYLGIKEIHRLTERTALVASASFTGFIVIFFVFGII